MYHPVSVLFEFVRIALLILYNCYLNICLLFKLLKAVLKETDLYKIIELYNTI